MSKNSELVCDLVEIPESLLIKLNGATPEISDQNLMAYLYHQGCPILVTDDGYAHDENWVRGFQRDDVRGVLTLMWRRKENDDS